MAKEKRFTPEMADACRVLLENDARKTHLAKSLDMTSPTLSRKLDKDELRRYRERDAKREKVIELHQKQA